MRRWNYLQVALHPQDLELASAVAAAMGTRGIEEQSLRSGQILLKAYFDPSQDIQKIGRDFESQCRGAAVSLLSCSAKVEKEKDWLRKWRRDLKPFVVGDRFLISPRRHFPNPGSQDRIFIWLEPRMAFGTGTHETTQLCLEALEELSLTGKKVLDIGTGSGILAIACAKMGAGSILACDIDPIAIQAAHTNCRRNKVDHRVDLIGGDVDAIDKSPFDVILANLNFGVIRQKLSAFGRRLKPDGQLILSGILQEEATRRCELEGGRPLALKVLKHRRKGDWCCLVLQKGRRVRTATA